MGEAKVVKGTIELQKEYEAFNHAQQWFNAAKANIFELATPHHIITDEGLILRLDKEAQKLLNEIQKQQDEYNATNFPNVKRLP